MANMTSPANGSPRHTGLLLASVFAIPVLSVTLAARLGDVASTTDPRDAIAGAIALVGGVVVGLLVRRLVTTVDTRVRGVVRFVAQTLRPLPGAVLDTLAVAWRLADEAPRPRLAFVPAETGRRGPPVLVR